MGGRFAFADGIRVNSIARWDGTAWSTLGSGVGNPTDTNGTVHALAVHDDGSGEALYVGGFFFGASGLEVNHIARWDGTAWSALDNGLDGAVFALQTFDDGSGTKLYASTPTAIQRWDGSTWQAIAPHRAEALGAFDDGTGTQLYAAAGISIDGGLTSNIARWDGTAWHPLGDFPDNDGVEVGLVHALATFDDGNGEKLYVGGSFQRAGGQNLPHLAAWTGIAWEAVPSPPILDRVCSLHVSDEGTPRLIAGIEAAEGAVVYAYDGQTWTELAGAERLGPSFDCVRSFGTWAGPSTEVGPVLFAAGDFVRGGEALNLSRVAQWDGQDWSAVSSTPNLLGIDDQVNAMEIYDDGSGPALYIGGLIRYAGDAAPRGVARYEGTTWSPLRDAQGVGLYIFDQSVSSGVQDLEVFDDGSGPKLYAIGNIFRPGLSNHIAAWDGTEWLPVGGDLSNGGEDLQAFDDGQDAALYLSGPFTTASGITVNGIAKWDGTAYSALAGPGGPGVNGDIRDLEVFDDGNGPALYVGGGFTEAGGLDTPYLARWHPVDGWSAVNGLNLDFSVLSMEVYDDGTGPALFIGGAFDTVNGELAHGLVKWDGTTASLLEGTEGVGVLLEGERGFPQSLLAYDAGAGERLYVGGSFDSAGGLSVHGTAAWDGSRWHALVGDQPILNEDNFGSSTSIESFFGFEDDGLPTLFIGGEFTHIGGIPSWHLGRYREMSGVFSDGFESGSFSAWSAVIGNP